MFARTVETRAGNKTHRYLRVVENYRADGKVKQRVVANLGNLEKIRPGLLGLTRSLSRYTGEKFLPLRELRSERARQYGNVLLLKKLWDSLNLQAFFDNKMGKKVRSCIEAMVFHRLLNPSGAPALHQWLSQVYLPGLEGHPRGEEGLRKRVRASLESLGQGGVEKGLRVRLKTLSKVSPCCYIVKVRDKGREKKAGVFLALLSMGGIPASYNISQGVADRAFIKAVLMGLGRTRVVFLSRRSDLRRDALNFIEQEGLPYITFYQTKETDREPFGIRGPRAGLRRPKSRKGLYLLYERTPKGFFCCTFRTNAYRRLPAQKVIKTYKNLCELENTLVETTPPLGIASKTAQRGYLSVCFMSYLLEKTLSRRLRQAGLYARPYTLLEGLKDVKLVTNLVGGERLNCLTRIPRHARKSLGLFGIKRLNRTPQVKQS